MSHCALLFLLSPLLLFLTYVISVNYHSDLLYPWWTFILPCKLLFQLYVNFTNSYYIFMNSCSCLTSPSGAFLTFSHQSNDRLFVDSLCVFPALRHLYKPLLLLHATLLSSYKLCKPFLPYFTLMNLFWPTAHLWPLIPALWNVISVLLNLYQQYFLLYMIISSYSCLLNSYSLLLLFCLMSPLWTIVIPLRLLMLSHCTLHITYIWIHIMSSLYPPISALCHSYELLLLPYSMFIGLHSCLMSLLWAVVNALLHITYFHSHILYTLYFCMMSSCFCCTVRQPYELLFLSYACRLLERCPSSLRPPSLFREATGDHTFILFTLTDKQLQCS